MNEEVKLPDDLQMAYEFARAVWPVAGTTADKRMSASDAIRTEHTQRLTLQHHAADLAQRVADLEAERDEWQRIASAYSPAKELAEALKQSRASGDAARNERDELRARLAELERQEPVAHLCRYRSGEEFASLARQPLIDKDVESSLPLYARPIPATPEGWKLIASDPADGGLYLVLIGDQPHVARFSNRTSFAKWWSAYGIPSAVAQEPTHWMPIPDAPEHEA